MRIALVHQPWNAVVPPVQAGSIAIWNDDVGRRLARSHDVTAFARTSANAPAEETREGVRYRRLSTFPAPYGRLWRALKIVSPGSRERLPEFARPDYYAAFAARVSRSIARDGADVIHVHNLSHFVPVLRRYNPGARILLHMHCEWLTQLPFDVVRARIAQADGIAGCSGYIAGTIAGRFPEFAGRVGVLHNGVDVETFTPSSEETPRGGRGPVLLYVGRVSPEKGIHFLLDAFREVVREKPDASLRIVGPDAETPREFLVSVTEDPMVRALESFYGASYLEQLRDRAEKEFPGRVDFAGVVPHERLPDVYRRADVLVNPSLSEAFGMSLIEAGACGVPVVGCDTGGMPETMRAGESGLLVKRGDTDGLARAILTLLADGELRRAFGKRGAEWVSQRFGWERVAADTEARYEALVQGRGGGG